MKLDKDVLEALKTETQMRTKNAYIDGYRVWCQELNEEYKYGFSNVDKCYKIGFIFGDKRLDVTLPNDNLDVKKVSKQVGRLVKKINKEVGRNGE